jgi:hypothetical protein
LVGGWVVNLVVQRLPILLVGGTEGTWQTANEVAKFGKVAGSVCDMFQDLYYLT